MKKLFLLMCVCAGLCACSSDDDLVGSSSSAIQDGSVAYLTVNLNDVGSATRATDGGFKYGTTVEQKVNNAYFYFYDANGNYMAKGNAVPTGTSTGESGENDANIEWTSNTLVAVWGLSGTLPTQMLTVLNQPSSFDGTNKTLAQATAALIEPSYMDSNNGFVMSTSVYDANSGVVNTNTLTANDFYLEPVDLNNTTGVPVYVERLAAKVSVTNAISTENATTVGELSGYKIADNGEFINYPNDGVFVTLLGWDVDCVARSEYLSKNIDAYSGWSSLSFVWNGAGNYRTYWAESPNYDETHTYPTSNSTFNTDSDEDTNPLDEYLRYVSLKAPVDLGDATYCGENTNTVDVLGDATSTGITNAIVKAQVVDAEGEPIEIVKYHGEYIPLTDFENDMIAEVERYDFSSMIDEVGAAIEGSASGTVANYIHQFIEAIEPVIYCQAKEGDDESYFQFDGRFMEFTNKGDGYVGVWFDTATSVDTDGNAHSNHSDTYPDKKIPDDYNANVVRKAKESMDNYDFYFKLKTEDIDGMSSLIVTLLEQLGFVTVGKEIDFDGNETTGYFLPLDDATFQITVNDDESHVYGARNYLIRVIERESAGIDDDWEQSGYPNLYTDGLMYYSVPIEHLANAEEDATEIVEGQYGIVRNHWYDISITSLANFGHGIADEAEVIVPQVEDDYYYVGAVINILSWKHLTQEVGF